MSGDCCWHSPVLISTRVSFSCLSYSNPACLSCNSYCTCLLTPCIRPFTREKVMASRCSSSLLPLLLGFICPDHTLITQTVELIYYRQYLLVMLHTVSVVIEIVEPQTQGTGHRDTYKWLAFSIVSWISNVGGRIEDGPICYRFSPSTLPGQLYPMGRTASATNIT